MAVKEEIFKYGNVIISDEVISIIAGIAASEIKGVNSSASGFFDGLTSMFTRKNYSKGINIEMLNDNEVYIEMNVAVDYGNNVQNIAKKIQDKVAGEVENMTGMKVSKINVNISSVQFGKDKTKNNKEEGKDLSNE